MNREPNLRYSKSQQLVSNPDKLGGYDEVPMAGVVRIIMFATAPMVSFVIAVAMAGVMMALMATNIPTWFLGIIFVTLRSFDMDVRDVISRMAVPHGGARPRRRTCIEQ